MNEIVATYEQAMEKHFGWNFVVLAGENAMFSFVMTFLSPYTVLPSFLSHFTSVPYIIGTIPAIMEVGHFAPQMFAARYLESVDRRKGFILYAAGIQRLCMVVIVLLGFLASHINVTLFVALFLLACCVMSLGAGTLQPAWGDAVLRAIVRRRGMFFALSSVVGGGLGVMAGLLLDRLLRVTAFPGNYGYTFLAGFAAAMVSYAFLCLMKEEKVPQVKPPVGIRVYLKGLPRLLANDRAFLGFVVAFGIVYLGTMAFPFYSVYATQVLGAPERLVAVFTTVLVVSETLASLLWGWVGDRYNFRTVIAAAAVAGLSGSVCALVARSPFGFYGVFFLMGISLSGLAISSVPVVAEFKLRDNAPTCLAVVNLVRGTAAALAPLIGGAVGQLVGYRSSFGLSAGLFAVGAAVATLTFRRTSCSRRS